MLWSCSDCALALLFPRRIIPWAAQSSSLNLIIPGREFQVLPFGFACHVRAREGRCGTEPHSRLSVARFSSKSDARARATDAGTGSLRPPISDTTRTPDAAWPVISSIHLPLSPANSTSLVRHARSQGKPMGHLPPPKSLKCVTYEIQLPLTTAASLRGATEIHIAVH